MLNSIKQSLKQNGILLASLIGGYSLKELKTVFKKIDYDYYKGLYPRFIPMIDIQDLGNLLQTIGFKNPIVKSETFIKHYIHIKDIVADLRKAKQGNYILDRKKTFTSKSVFQQAQNYYYEVYAKNNMLPASFDILTAIAYK
jgi:hypothetical protein